jgi:SEC-C motif-containing protein
MRCPCGRPGAYEACCGRFILGWEAPETAEDLMRSRYSAYALAEIDYLVATHDPRRAPDRDQIQAWAKRAKFLGLEIEELAEGGSEDATGIVQFLARYEEGGAALEHRERSRFERIDGRWMYVDALPVKRPRR